MKLAVFIERDGILNRVRVERHYQVSPMMMDQFEINRDAIEPMKRLKAEGFLLIATTNQPGLSRGYQSRSELDRMHAALRKTFALDEILVCPHDETDHCPCRKPKPGLITEAAFRWKLLLDRCFVLSDKWQDAEAARVTGCISVLIESPWLKNVHRDVVVANIAAAVEKICAMKDTRGVNLSR